MKNYFPGFFCETPGLGQVTGPCSNGSYCPLGSKVPSPITCPKGFHCPTGSAIPQPCVNGYYTNSTGASACLICPDSFYCLPLNFTGNNVTDVGYRICPRGYYCPAGTGSDWKRCPAGTYSNETSLYNVNQCKSCDAGMYCDGTLLVRPNGLCSAGYYCTVGKYVVQCHQ